MNLTQLRYVKAVAETGSFTLAAEQCHVTQPTLSNGIAQLEQEFEERLFARTTRTVVLTPFGKHILPFIDKVLRAQAELLLETRNFVHPSRAVVRIGTSPLLGANWLAPMLEEFRKMHPDVEIILHEQNMAELYRMLMRDFSTFSSELRMRQSHPGREPFSTGNRCTLFRVVRGLPRVQERSTLMILPTKLLSWFPTDAVLRGRPAPCSGVTGTG